MGKALIIGCGGVASVAIHKCCQNSEVFEERLTREGIRFDERLQIGATIGTHIGPGAFGLVYVEKEQ